MINGQFFMNQPVCTEILRKGTFILWLKKKGKIVPMKFCFGKFFKM